MKTNLLIILRELITILTEHSTLFVLSKKDSLTPYPMAGGNEMILQYVWLGVEPDNENDIDHNCTINVNKTGVTIIPHKHLV